MASAPNHIDPTGYVDDLLAQASPDLMRLMRLMRQMLQMLQMLQDIINLLLSAQADQVCGAEYGTTSNTRTNRRNGCRHRDLDTRVGTVDVAVPKLRQGSYFPDWLLDHRTRVESALTSALTSAVATAYLKGVSTRRMDELVRSLGITGMSKSQVSTMAKDLDSMVADFRTRPLDAGPRTPTPGRRPLDADPWTPTPGRRPLPVHVSRRVDDQGQRRRPGGENLGPAGDRHER